MSTRRWAGGVVGAMLGCLLLSGCGDDPGVDVRALEGYLAGNQATMFAGSDIGAARCPGHPALKESMKLHCTLEVDDADVPYLITMRHVHSSTVSVDVAMEAVVLRATDIRGIVRGQLPKKYAEAEVTCGAGLIVAQVGDTVDCTLSVGAQQRPVSLKVEDDEGHVSLV